jgi:hypothetical protein
MKKANVCLNTFNNQVIFSTEDGRDISIHVNPFLFNKVMNHEEL